MANTIKINRGVKGSIPTLEAGEPAFCTETKELAVGDGTANHYYELVKVGQVIMWPLATPPSNHLECNGAAISRATYSALFAVIGETYGAGDASTTFNLPDYRGYFLRGWDHGAGNDPDAASRTDRGDGTAGDNIGTKQADAFESHVHPYETITVSNINQNTTGGGVPHPTGTGAVNTTATGGNETRPQNVNIMFCIRY